MSSTIRACLVVATTIALFIAIGSWTYYMVAFALWVFVFGDDSRTFGYFAIAASIPISCIVVVAWWKVARRFAFSAPVLVSALLISVVLEGVFLICISM